MGSPFTVTKSDKCTFVPCSVTTTPLTFTTPFSINSSACRREQIPASAINLFKRNVAFDEARDDFFEPLLGTLFRGALLTMAIVFVLVPVVLDAVALLRGVRTACVERTACGLRTDCFGVDATSVGAESNTGDSYGRSSRSAKGLVRGVVNGLALAPFVAVRRTPVLADDLLERSSEDLENDLTEGRAEDFSKGLSEVPDDDDLPNGFPDGLPAGFPSGLPEAGLPEVGFPEAGLPDEGLPDALRGDDDELPALRTVALAEARPVERPPASIRPVEGVLLEEFLEELLEELFEEEAGRPRDGDFMDRCSLDEGKTMGICARK
jgi:hypothetical protein